MAMTLRLDTDHDEMAQRLAKAFGCSKHEAIIRAIEMTDTRVSLKETALRKAQHILETRDKELMDRLADS
ncbi:CopG family transcriptional regulator [Pontimonas salivibrio]|nr:CopG family transcriptional regulator [Pontimonas salivibrio]